MREVVNFEKRPELGPRRTELEPIQPGIVAIFTASAAGEPMTQQTSVLVKAGLGIIGDRYAAKEGTYSGKVATRKTGQKIGDKERQITFISLPGIEQANQILIAQEEELFTMAETRRNIVVSISAEDLNNLVNKRFRFGGIEFEGVEKCDPCKRPPRLAERPKDKEYLFEGAFADRGGLRARILNNGRLHAGDSLKYLAFEV